MTAEYPYQEFIRSLLFLMPVSGPDRTVLVGELAQYSFAPSLVHWEAVNESFFTSKDLRIMGYRFYLPATPPFGVPPVLIGPAVRKLICRRGVSHSLLMADPCLGARKSRPYLLLRRAKWGMSPHFMPLRKLFGSHDFSGTLETHPPVRASRSLCRQSSTHCHRSL